MNRENIIRMAREVGFHRPVPADGYMGLAYDRREGRETGGSLERFAALVAAAERDRMCEQFNIPKELAHEKAKSNETD